MPDSEIMIVQIFSIIIIVYFHQYFTFYFKVDMTLDINIAPDLAGNKFRKKYSMPKNKLH
jgi:hypothetical protein